MSNHHACHGRRGIAALLPSRRTRCPESGCACSCSDHGDNALNPGATHTAANNTAPNTNTDGTNPAASAAPKSPVFKRTTPSGSQHDTHRNTNRPTRTVAFAGNPNVGKSSLFNVILGTHAKVMNAPGTTVLLEQGRYRRGNELWNVVDTPGTYSLLALSPDERVTVNMLTGTGNRRSPDAIVAVVDATNISRSLYFLAMIVQLGRPTVVALTMNDLARAEGAGINPQRLSQALDGIPVVEVDGRTGRGSARLLDAIEASFDGTPLPHGLAPYDPEHTDLDAWVHDGADERFAWAASIIDDCDFAGRDHATISDYIDRLLLHPILGIVIFLAVMLGVFQATTTLAGPGQEWFDTTVRGWCTSGINIIFNLFGPTATDSWLHGLMVDAILDGFITVATFIPPMSIMFLLLSLLEDSGYLARAAFVMDRAMRSVGLDGRAFLPIIVGFGCNLPALAATRTLPDSRQRVLVGMLIPFSSCSARLSVYVVLAYAFFRNQAGLVVFAMYLMSVLVILLIGLILRRFAFHDLKPEPFAMSLPAYQRPRVITLVRSVITRLWGFVRGASTIIITTIIALWVLQGIPATANAGSFGHVDDVHDSVYGVVADTVAPVFAPAGFDDWHASAALITGFVAKEVVVGSMSQSYSIDTDNQSERQQGEGMLGSAIRSSFNEASNGHGKAAAIAFLLFTLAYTPCLATIAELRRQFGTRVAMQSVGLSLICAYLLAVIAFQALRWLL